MLWWHDMSHVTELWVPPSRSLVMRQLLPFITDTHHLCLLVTGIVFTWLNIVTIIHFQWARHYYRWFSSWLTQHSSGQCQREATLSVDMLMGEGGSREWSGAGEGWMLDDAPLLPEAPFIICHPLHKYKQRIRVTFPWPEWDPQVVSLSSWESHTKPQTSLIRLKIGRSYCQSVLKNVSIKKQWPLNNFVPD